MKSGDKNHKSLRGLPREPGDGATPRDCPRRERAKAACLLSASKCYLRGGENVSTSLEDNR